MVETVAIIGHVVVINRLSRGSTIWELSAQIVRHVWYYVYQQVLSMLHRSLRLFQNIIQLWSVLSILGRFRCDRDTIVIVPVNQKTTSLSLSLSLPILFPTFKVHNFSNHFHTPDKVTLLNFASRLE